MTRMTKLPTRAHHNNAGLDLYSSGERTILPNVIEQVPTGIKIKLSAKTYGQICDKSGVSMTGLKVTAGVIDQGYTGEIYVVIKNTGDSEIKLKHGQAIAQLVCILCVIPYSPQVLLKEERNEKGFGSTNEQRNQQ